MHLIFFYFFIVLLSLGQASQSLAAEPQALTSSESISLRETVSSLKNDSRGPFAGIQWYCKDGSTHPAPGDPCARRGGGIQHGKLKSEAIRLRDQGFHIATIFGALREEDRTRFKYNSDFLASTVLERFLVQFDDGWIFRNARFYRGAAQVEDEINGIKLLFEELIKDPEWRNEHFLLLREAYRRLPIGQRDSVFSEIRSQSKQLATRYREFTNLKNKIHSFPDASDAASVRSFAQAHPVKTPEDFERLASQIDAAYSQPPLVSIIRALYPQTYNQKARELLDWGYNSLTRASNILEQYSVTARMMQYAREQFMETTELDQALLWLSLSESAGNSFFALRPEVIGFLAQGSRLNHLDALESALRASFASGGLSKRAFYTLMVEIASLKKSEVEQDEYAQHIQRLSRTIEFAASAYEWEFGHIVSNWSQMEPLANEFIAECLRSSPLAVYSEIFNQLQIDIDSLRNVRHQFFSKQVGSIDLRALNPGLAKGTLVDPALSQQGYQDPATSIYLVPHTIASIPRVAGILTKNEGNPVSHVQLLARNLGIPNIVVTPQLLPELQRALDTELLIASSPAGRVVIDSFGPQYHKLLSEDNRRKESSIDIDLDDLNLKFVQVTSLEELDGDHSSEIVGPKAGKLAELKKLFPGKVSPGIVLPFGVFAKILNVKMASGIPLSDWIKQQYQAIATFQGGAVERQQFVSQVLSTIRTTLLSLEFGPTFIAELKEKMETTFGPDGSYGVFVRSDTNVEDLPNFTGAGLNKTVPNVVGFNDVLAAILKVYASPFEERAFAWRQEFMKQPEHLYVSVLIQKTVPVQMSGVMITSNIFNGDDDFVTIASNEGVGGVVNNQRAEVLLVKRKDNAVELVSEACERTKKIVSRTGGIEKTSTSNQRRILFPNHLQALMNFTTELYDRYDESDMFDSDLFPADVEFGFVNDQLTLFQIRPFVESKSAKSNKFLVELDDEIDDSSRDISMTEPLKKPGIR